MRLAIDFQIRRRLTTLIDIRKQLNFTRISLFFTSPLSLYPLTAFPSSFFSENRKDASRALLEKDLI